MTITVPRKRSSSSKSQRLAARSRWLVGSSSTIDVGLLVEHAHQVDAPALAARERVEVLEQEVLLEPQSGGQARDLGLGLVATALAEVRLERGEALDGLLGRIGRQRVAGVLHVGVELVEAARREHVARARWARRRGRRGTGSWGRWLIVPWWLHRAGDAQVLGVLAEQHRQQRRLAGAVAPDQADLLAVADGEGDRGRGDVAHRSRFPDHGRSAFSALTTQRRRQVRRETAGGEPRRGWRWSLRPSVRARRSRLPRPRQHPPAAVVR